MKKDEKKAPTRAPTATITAYWIAFGGEGVVLSPQRQINRLRGGKQAPGRLDCADLLAFVRRTNYEKHST
jgi:hypothetical protein